MSKHLQLSIPAPCHENWDKMTKVEKGKFCGSCQKQVIDFSSMSDREIATFFKKKSTGSVCGRFMEDQLDRSIEIPKKRIPWVKYFFQILIPGFLVSCGARTIGQVKANEIKTEVITDPTKTTCRQTLGFVMPEIILADTTENFIIGDTDIIDTSTIDSDKSCIEETLVVDTLSIPFQETDINQVVSGSIDTTTIKGEITDEDNKSIPYASVLIKGSLEGIAADHDGNFSIKVNARQNPVLVISSVGFELKEIELKNYNLNDGLKIQLKSNEALGEVVVAGIVSTKCYRTTGAVSVITKSYNEERIQLEIQPISFKVFPNPTHPNSNISIEWKQNEKGTYLLQLYNASGQLYFTKQLSVDNETRLLNVQLPSVSAGNYFVRMTNKNSGKGYTEKIIVQ